ncbi:inositol monophosphatase family protein [Aidingimonas halophila]|uniref:Inositol-1-monophosphatase n=1 Tax=Aidingimonas halophila TaxID=574349 RepID=A0A1H3BUB7_9GAMM|nr:inositol monophosphatase family protein [Aidingimonas halophila]GHC27121.1 inositol monophosphatase [Aidingimonas halophila]SDX45228.1 myo-inositol-1(or 4)-monophosphatase [Aidingimonas halophila]
MRLTERLDSAIDIATRAGQQIREARQHQEFDRHYKQGSELVTDIDVAVDTAIGDALEARFPDEHRLTEELSPDQQSLDFQQPLWVIDPIDGTVNFAQGLAHVAVSIAWVKEGQVQLGVVHAPFLNETFTAIRGQGAYRNGERIRVSRADKLARSLVATGFPYRRDSRTPLMRRLTAILTNCQDIRRNGSAALDLCDVACGRLDAYYESVKPWDFAAGLLIAREAGARTGHLYPCPQGMPTDLYGENIVVSAPDIYGSLTDLLKRADADRVIDS